MISIKTMDLLEDFEEFDRRLSTTPPPRPVTLKDDPVVLACASYRMGQENPRHRWIDFDEVVVWQDDREQAERLKAYYRSQFVETTFKMLKSVNNQGLSSFRHKLYLLANNSLPITDREIGMLYRLPYFYAEDQALDEIRQTTATLTEQVPAHKQSLNLVLFKKVLKSRSKGETNQYWFRDESNSHAYMMPVAVDNPLSGLFDSLSSRTLKLESTVVCKQMQGRRGHMYFQLINPRAV